MSERTTRQRVLIQVLFVVVLLVAAGAILVTGISFISSSLGASRSTPTSSSSSCPFRTGCTEKTIEEVSSDTGFPFPDGSTVIWSYEETSWFDKSWAMRALVKMPPGSTLPTSSATNATATIKRNDSSGVEIEVAVLAPEGR